MNSSPPLNALRFFLVACRHRSFTSAAEELSVTHGAVSRQMKQLEDWLGHPLFEREGQCMAPTAHALAYAEEIAQAFGRIQEASLSYGKGLTTRLLRVSAPATFAMKWLIPRLSAFKERYRDARVQVQTATTQQLGLGGAFDLAIRRDAPVQAAYSGFPLFEEWQTLIASPQLLLANPIREPGDVNQHTWIYTDTRPRHWDAWLTAAGLPNRPWDTLRFDHFYVSYSAVLDGLGLGIGPFPTLSNEAGLGRIVAPFPHIRTPARQYWAITPSATQKTLLHRQFEEWLQEEAGKEDTAARQG
ncbi:LysR family transcriptional regulator [Alcaligenaceae bacterium]|nr:LysR family transcriptional regulator [Alcaligenaceae bacterium]